MRPWTRGRHASTNVIDCVTIAPNRGRTAAAGVVLRCPASVSRVFQTPQPGRVLQVGTLEVRDDFAGRTHCKAVVRPFASNGWYRGQERARKQRRVFTHLVSQRAGAAGGRARVPSRRSVAGGPGGPVSAARRGATGRSCVPWR